MPVLRAARSAEELALLRNVVANPEDDIALSIYCDWLEEHGDKRGPFLRTFMDWFARRQALPTIPPEMPRAWVDLLGLGFRRRLRHGIELPDKEMEAHMRSEYPDGFGFVEPFVPEILRNAVPGIRMQTDRVLSAEDLPLGTTRTGGLPDLPVGMAWPIPVDESTPMLFLFQLALEDLQGTIAEGRLPGEGLLVVFYWPWDAGVPRVIYVPPGTPLHRVRHPQDAKSRMGGTVERGLQNSNPGESASEWILDEPHSLILSDAIRFLKEPRGLPEGFFLPHLTDPDWFNFNEPRRIHWLATPCKPNVDWRWDSLDETPADQLLELAYLLDQEGLSWAFGDGDPLYILMPAEDARIGDFSRVSMHDVS